MTQSLSDKDVRVEFVVEAPPDRAFEVFTVGIDSWWPRAHHIGAGDLVEEVMEPRPGGRCYGREADGTECPWGTVLEWDPPHHVAFSWQISLDWKYQPDPARASRVDVTFAPEGSDRTRVTLVHSGFERHGTDWGSMRDAVGSPEGWPALTETYGKAVAG
ncbi:ATPase [Nocardia yunnanensis]|uniref:ATPase n=1 Tax=Nocardia yunnanensis TaxID=2382165 RepID=A0A386ZP44_9NOCA|nr:SRPBCC family protein [Nocardia yunnanensis]AYF78469.1 ATPase [Nocardia yunnanensis]